MVRRPFGPAAIDRLRATLLHGWRPVSDGDRLSAWLDPEPHRSAEQTGNFLLSSTRPRLPVQASRQGEAFDLISRKATATCCGSGRLEAAGHRSENWFWLLVWAEASLGLQPSLAGLSEFWRSLTAGAEPERIRGCEQEAGSHQLAGTQVGLVASGSSASTPCCAIDAGEMVLIPVGGANRASPLGRWRAAHQPRCCRVRSAYTWPDPCRGGPRRRAWSPGP